MALGDRIVILHYHLFKNAGTSFDAILQQNFPDKWVTAEFSTQGADNSAEVADWIAANPGAVAFSSHTMLGPVPAVEGVKILPVMFFRDPLARIASAYRFERTQQADTFGARLAKEVDDLAGYVHRRLERREDRQCRNFQTARLASLCPGPEPEFDRAVFALDRLALAGLVEQFDASLQMLQAKLHPYHPDFEPGSAHLNRSGGQGGPERQIDADAELIEVLRAENAADLRLLEVVRNRAAGERARHAT
ncbi:MAG: hypothetical protein AAGE18_12270 [Pseudomonadota bacterium]